MRLMMSGCRVMRLNWLICRSYRISFIHHPRHERQESLSNRSILAQLTLHAFLPESKGLSQFSLRYFRFLPVKTGLRLSHI